MPASAELSWEAKFACLLAYKQTHGDMNVPDRYIDPNSEFPLGAWVTELRQTDGELNNEQIKQLEDEGFFSWKNNNNSSERKQRGPPKHKGRSHLAWEHKLALLREYKEAHGTAHVPKNYIDPETGFCLGMWTINIRRTWKQGKLSAGKESDLKDLGFHWDRTKEGHAWGDKLEMMARFYAANGNYNVPYNYKDPITCFCLGEVVSGWRNNRSGSRFQLTENQRQDLKNIGFDFDKKNTEDRPNKTKAEKQNQEGSKPLKGKLSWEDKLSALQNFHETFGHYEIPYYYKDPDTGFNIGHLVSGWKNQRAEGRFQLSDQEKAGLEKIGFVLASTKKDDNENQIAYLGLLVQQQQQLMLESDQDDATESENENSKKPPAKRAKTMPHYPPGSKEAELIEQAKTEAQQIQEQARKDAERAAAMLIRQAKRRARAQAELVLARQKQSQHAFAHLQARRDALTAAVTVTNTEQQQPQPEYEQASHLLQALAYIELQQQPEFWMEA